MAKEADASHRLAKKTFPSKLLGGKIPHFLSHPCFIAVLDAALPRTVFSQRYKPFRCFVLCSVVCADLNKKANVRCRIVTNGYTTAAAQQQSGSGIASSSKTVVPEIEIFNVYDSLSDMSDEEDGSGGDRAVDKRAKVEIWPNNVKGPMSICKHRVHPARSLL